MAREVFVGDRVSTPYGNGYVYDACSWREKVLGMSSAEAVEFTERCKVESGTNYKEDWVEVFVNVGGVVRRLIGSQVEVLEGRDDKKKR